MYERILVPLDGSEFAEIVLPYAEEIAARFSSEIMLVSVSTSDAIDKGHLYRSYQESIINKVRHQLKAFAPNERASVHGEVLFGNPADEILRHASKKKVSLIAMASYGSSGPGLWPLGSVAAKILWATEKTVLLVRDPANSASVNQRKVVKKIIIPLDGSKLGEAAIPWVEVLAQALNAELVLFQVVEPVIVMAGYEGAPYALPDATTYLNSVQKSLRNTGLAISSAVVLGSPAGKIIDYTEANSIDLIAMSSHGRSGIGRWVFGSVTNKVLHAGHTAVLVVRAQTAEA